MATPQCSVQADDVFGPAVASSCRGGFDFTLLFEQALLGIAPAVIFALAFPPRFAYLARTSTKTLAGPWRIWKLTVAAILAALQLAQLVLWSRSGTNRTQVSLPSAVLNLVVALELVALSWMEDARSVRPSSLLSVYLVFTLLFDIAQVRTLWLRLPKTDTPLAAVFTSSTAVKLVLLFLEARQKKAYLRSGYGHLPPESTSGIISHSFLWWVNDLFRRGFRSLLTSEDLYTLDGKLLSAPLGIAIKKAWDRRQTPERRFEFPWAACRALWWPFLSPAFPRLCLIGFTFAQPFLISRALTLLVQNPNPGSQNSGYGLIGATVLIYLGLAVSTLHYNQKLYRFATMFRGATVALIYEHMLALPVGAYDEPAALTLMSTDVDRVIFCLVDLNECWARSIEVAVGIALLALQLGWVCVVPVLVVIVSFFGVTQISRTIGDRQRIWVDAVQKRISMTASVLSDMKSVKMMGLSRLLTKLVQGQRVEETHRMAAFRWSIVAQNVVQNLPWFLAPSLTFVIYAAQAISQGKLAIETTQAFTSLSIITLLTDSSAKLLSAIPSTAASLGCFERIQKFLVSRPREDHRVVIPSSSVQISPATSGAVVDDRVRMAGPAQNTPRGKDVGEIAVLFDRISVRLGPSEELVLQEANFIITRKSLTMVIGPVGSGKTTLLKAILGEVPYESDGGHVSIISRRIAFAAQTPWLPDTTIRQAIAGPIGLEELDEAWYAKCLYACALDHDIGLLPEGDQTKIGSASTVLSGGQKHRVALARTVYSRAQVILLDDVLGALDLKTQAAVMSRLFGESGLLRGLDITVILVTHATHHLKYADKILVVSGGRVEDGGTYDQVVRREGLLSDAFRSDSGREATELKSDTELRGAEEKAEKTAQTNERDDLSRATGDLTLYRYYFRSVGLLGSAMFTGSVIVNIFCHSFGQIWLNRWAESGGGQIAFYMGIYLGLAALAVVGLSGYVWTMLIYITPSTARKFHSVLLNVVMRAPQSFFSTIDSGSILNRFSQDMTLIEGQLPTAVLVTISNFFDSMAAAALVATGSSFMATTIPLLILAICVLQHVYLRTSRQLRLLDLEARSPLYSHFLESLAGLATIRAFGWEEQFKEQNHKRLDYSQQPYYLLYCIQRWLNLVLDLIVGAEAVLVMGLAMWLRTSTTPGLLGVSLNNILSFSSSLSSLVSGWTMLETSLGSIARLRDFEATVKPEDKATEIYEPPNNWPDRGAIEFRDVTASHSPGAIGIRNITLAFKPGQRIGICGRTGSGKSSLVSTLLRLLEIDRGSIHIDNLDISTIPRETIRERLLVVPQEPLILAGSLRFNTDPEGGADDAAICSALQRVGLTDLLSASRGGLDANIAPSTLSQGQKQLLALARLLLKKQKQGGAVLVLDEAASSVDTAADAMLQRVVREDFSGCTTVAVAHRLDTIMDSDVIVVMDGGSVVEVGAPAELLRRVDGWFSRLAAAGEQQKQ